MRLSLPLPAPAPDPRTDAGPEALVPALVAEMGGGRNRDRPKAGSRRLWVVPEAVVTAVYVLVKPKFY